MSWRLYQWPESRCYKQFLLCLYGILVQCFKRYSLLLFSPLWATCKVYLASMYLLELFKSNFAFAGAAWFWRFILPDWAWVFLSMNFWSHWKLMEVGHAANIFHVGFVFKCTGILSSIQCSCYYHMEISIEQQDSVFETHPLSLQ